jgi:hypothetical protein
MALDGSARRPERSRPKSTRGSTNKEATSVNKDEEALLPLRHVAVYVCLCVCVLFVCNMSIFALCVFL